MSGYKTLEMFGPNGAPSPVTLEGLRSEGVKISGDTVSLHPISIHDASDYLALIEHDRTHLSQFGDQTSLRYPDLAAVEDSIQNPCNPSRLRFCIRSQAAGTMVGSISLTPEDEVSAELVYWIGAEHTQRGYASDSLAALADYAFNALAYRRLVAIIADGNTASESTALKCGFQPTSKIFVKYFKDPDSGDYDSFAFNEYFLAKNEPA